MDKHRVSSGDTGMPSGTSSGGGGSIRSSTHSARSAKGTFGSKSQREHWSTVVSSAGGRLKAIAHIMCPDDEGRGGCGESGQVAKGRRKVITFNYCNIG